jgi:hypothetical protein
LKHLDNNKFLIKLVLPEENSQIRDKVLSHMHQLLMKVLDFAAHAILNKSLAATHDFLLIILVQDDVFTQREPLLVVDVHCLREDRNVVACAHLKLLAADLLVQLYEDAVSRLIVARDLQH